jgi:cobalt transporter subunit CbtA
MGPAITVILRRILTAGLFAGLIAGTAVTVVQMLQITPLILAAEVFEDSAPAPAHVHDGATAGEHDHDGAPEAWAPADGLERGAFTWLANILTGTGFGLILAAAMAFAGRPTDARRGLLWGLAGYGVFAVAPALGLPPELPGMMAADLAARQVWWIMTVGGTAAGLALIVFAPSKPYKRPLQVAGLALILLPHLLGAPHLAAEAGAVPAELAARFVVASLAAAALFWVVLGAVVGHVMARLLPATPARAGSPQPA